MLWYFPPSQKLIQYVASYLYYTIVNSKDGSEIELWAKYSLRRLDHTSAKGRRKFIPNVSEIQAIMQRKPVTVNVHYLDGRSRNILVDSQTRVDEALESLAETLKLTNPAVYGLYDMETQPPGYIQDYFAELEKKKLKRHQKVNALIKSVPINKHLEKEEGILDIISGWEFGKYKDRKFNLIT
eukprot:UN27559